MQSVADRASHAGCRSSSRLSPFAASPQPFEGMVVFRADLMRTDAYGGHTSVGRRRVTSGCRAAERGHVRMSGDTGGRVGLGQPLRVPEFRQRVTRSGWTSRSPPRSVAPAPVERAGARIGCGRPPSFRSTAACGRRAAVVTLRDDGRAKCTRPGRRPGDHGSRWSHYSRARSAGEELTWDGPPTGRTRGPGFAPGRSAGGRCGSCAGRSSPSCCSSAAWPRCSSACRSSRCGPPPATILLTGALVLLGLVHTEIASKVERMRRRVSDTSYYDLSSVWTFAAALLLPPPLAATVVVAVYLHLWVRVWRPAKSPALPQHLHRRRGRPRGPGRARRGQRARAASRAGRDGSGRAGRARAGRGGLRPGQQHPRDRRDRAAGACRPPTPGTGAPPARQGRRHRAGDRHAVAGRADRRVRDAQPVARPARAGAAGGAAPRRHGPPARAAGRDGRQDRPAQRRGLARQGRAGAAPRRSAREPRPVSSSSTSTTSSPSTTPTGTSRATRCWPRSPRRCAPRCARATSSAGSAARSSSCCCATSS